MTQSYRETDGEPEPIRRAKAFLRVATQIPIAFAPGQRIVGSPACDPSATEIEPELMTSWLEREVELDGRRMSELDAIPLRGSTAFALDVEDTRELEQDILPYWRTRCIGYRVLKELELGFPEAWDYNLQSGAYWRAIAAGLSHTIQDYRGVLTRGLLAMQAEIGERTAALDAACPSDRHLFERRHSSEAMRLCADAVMVYARRCGQHALALAAAESDPGRAAELRDIARICDKVPARPAESWHEALQSWRFLHLATGLFESGFSHSAGRFEQYMLPWLKADLAAGRIDLSRAQELLECFFVAWNERQALRPYLSARALAGDRTNDKLTKGGTDWRGRDATNRLTFMCLEAHAHVHLKEPNLSLRLHRGTPDGLLARGLEVIRLGSGLPQIINDEVIIPSLVANCGVSLVDARDYADIGCQENATDPNMGRGADAHGMTNIGWFNLTKTVELALFNGVNRMTGRQVGPATGDPRAFASVEQFLEAVACQVEHCARMTAILDNVMEFCYTRYLPMVYHDLMHPGPRQSGVDINAWGCRTTGRGSSGWVWPARPTRWPPSTLSSSGRGRSPGTSCWRRWRPTALDTRSYADDVSPRRSTGPTTTMPTGGPGGCSISSSMPMRDCAPAGAARSCAGWCPWVTIPFWGPSPGRAPTDGGPASCSRIRWPPRLRHRCWGPPRPTDPSPRPSTRCGPPTASPSTSG